MLYALNQHKKTHNRAWKCPYGLCKIACDSSSHLQRHIHEKHELDPSRSYQCLERHCPKYSKFFPRKNNFKRHYQNYEKFHGSWQDGR
ncbi:hypothetical protein BKA65DRAFT_492292 [Rhexocercosporidium sp. MPI-PUGE-AT-0058]|nr:hypothetical protein BKA65DRAFT_492292 [Rhexocercosporidium sp. MPI-PUGE-AT-0058]